jgi:glutamate 5-kinase
MAREKRVVVKIGTTTVCGDGLEPDPGFLADVADQVARLREAGHEVLIVSSGAIGSGMGALGYDERVREVPVRQALAAVGQARLIDAWAEAFEPHGIEVGQLLLTYEALRDRDAFLNMRNATEALLDLGVVPIVNENDTVSVEEITGTAEGEAEDPVDALSKSFGDNDRLSAIVAQKARADLLVLLTDVDGLHTGPPDESGTERVPVVEQVTEDVLDAAGDASGVGRGGMRGKVEAAREAARAGVPVVIAHGRDDRVLERVLDGEMVGTRVLAQGAGTEKKRWLRMARPEGRVHVDEGAREALAEGANLLPAGVTRVEGSFASGSVVALVHEGAAFAHAVTQLTARELDRAKGLHSDEVRERLGLDGSANVTRKRGLAFLGEGTRGVGG